ncbi:MAG TPA: TusE/DsrC/DsvC family sulfur relay protein [Rhizobiales bacterium]|nr:TusE/DsrC/DsvC family sulfur relay protein [Hyphomicrobiales bacterium]
MATGNYEVDGKKIPYDVEGYIVNLSDWSPELAEVIARSESIDLTPDHWEVINLVREYYDTFAIAPDIRVLVKYMKKKMGPEKGSKEYLARLFPGEGSPAARLAKIAGLPKPSGCI